MNNICCIYIALHMHYNNISRTSLKLCCSLTDGWIVQSSDYELSVMMDMCMLYARQCSEMHLLPCTPLFCRLLMADDYHDNIAMMLMIW